MEREWDGNGNRGGCERRIEEWKRGRGRRPVDDHRIGTGTGTGTETRAVVEIGTGMKMGTGTGTRTGSGRVDEKRRSARNRTIIVDTIRHFYSVRVIISADREYRLRSSDSPVRKALCLYARIVPRG